jgi:hypothetical protein
MTIVRLRADILRADRATADRWYVTNGATAVGPVGLELVERGIEAGKIPVESYIRHETWKIWRPLSELCITTEPKPIDPLGTPLPMAMPSDTGTFDPRQTTMKPAMTPPPSPVIVAPLEPVMLTVPSALPSVPAPSYEPRISIAAAAGETDADELAEPVSTTIPPILSRDVVEVDPEDVLEDMPSTPQRAPRVPPAPPSVEDITLPPQPPKTMDRVTGDPLSGADQLKDALLLLSGVILREVGCDGVMVHRVDDEGAVAVVAHGPRMFDVIGLRTRLLDPAIVAAAAGMLVVAEPTPGPAGQAIQERLRMLGVGGAGAVMLPIRPKGRLFGTLEMGQAGAFTGAAIAKAEGFVRVVTAKMEEAGWKLDGPAG